MKKDFVLKTIISLIISLVILSGCTKESDDNSVQLPVFDTLKGSWSWYGTHNGKHGGFTENEYKSIIKFISVNNDSSINFETYDNDTLFKKGKIVFNYNYYGERLMEPAMLSQLTSNLICFYFESKDTIILFDYGEDVDRYVYSKQD